MTFEGASYKNDEFRKVIWLYYAGQNSDYSKNIKKIQNANIGNPNLEGSLWCLLANEMNVFLIFEKVKSDPRVSSPRTKTDGCEAPGSSGWIKGGHRNKVKDQI